MILSDRGPGGGSRQARDLALPSELGVHLVHRLRPWSDVRQSQASRPAEFDYAGSSYALWVTDSVIEREYLSKDDGSTVSLGERDKGFCYKLVAAVIRQG